MSRVGGRWDWLGVRYVVSWASSDQEITFVYFAESQVDDRWLSQLRRFQNLQRLGLHDQQIAPGLTQLRDAEKLKSLSILSASKRSIAELARLPHLEGLYFFTPQEGNLGFENLSKFSKLKSLVFDNYSHTDEFLKNIPKLPQIEKLDLQDCQGFSVDDLVHLQRLPNLKYLDLVDCTPLSDAGFVQLSKLQNFETLLLRKSSGRITDVGLQAFQQLKKLKELIFIRGDLTPEQLNTLNQMLPNVSIRVN